MANILRLLKGEPEEGFKVGDLIRCNNAQDMVVTDFELTKAEQKWIPCTEMLPKDGDTYLVTIEYKGEVIGVDAASYSPVEGYIDKHWDTFNDWVEDDKMYYHVTAWMPLPEPHKAESEDKG